VVLGGLGALLLAVFVTLLVVRGGGKDDKQVTAGSSTTVESTTTTSSSTSTTVVAPTTTVAPTTVAPSSTAPASTAPAPVVNGNGALLRSPSSADTQVVAGPACPGLADPAWDSTCGTAAARGGSLAWLIETRTPTGGPTQRRARVFRQSGPNQWTLVLSVEDTGGSRFSAIRARVADVSGDGTEEVAFGFTAAGSTPNLAVDLVEGPGTVVVHRDLRRGSARVSTGQLNTWRQVSSDQAIHEVIQFRSGAWRVVSSSAEQPSDTPPSQL
jgi:hypothetical protein